MVVLGKIRDVSCLKCALLISFSKTFCVGYPLFYRKKNIQTETFCIKTVLKHVDVFFPGKTCIFRLQKTSLFAFCPLLFALCYTLNALCVS